MNKIFRTVWSDVRHTYVAVSEVTKTHGKKSGGSLTTPIRALLAAAVLSCGFFALPAFGGQSAYAAAETGSNTFNHQYVLISGGGSLELNAQHINTTSWNYVFVTDDNTIVTSDNSNNRAFSNGQAGGTRDETTGAITGGNTVTVQQKDSNGNYIDEYKEYKFTSFKNGVYTLTADDGSTLNAYRYGLYTLDGPSTTNHPSTKYGPYRIRDGYTVRPETHEKYFSNSNNDWVFDISYTGEGTAPTDVLEKVDHVTSLSGTSTNLNEALQTVTASTYVSAATGGALVNGSWDFWVMNDDGTYTDRRGTQYNASTSSGKLPGGFVTVGTDLQWNDTLKQYTYARNRAANNTGANDTGTRVATDNLYVIDGKLGIFTKNNQAEVYTGPVYGSGNEILLTTSRDGTFYSFWGANSTDPTQTLKDYPVTKYNADIGTLVLNDQKLAHNDINHVRVQSGNTNATISLYRNGTDMNGNTSLVDGQITIQAGGGENGVGATAGANDRTLTISANSSDSSSKTFNMGSRVGLTSDLASGTTNLQRLTINGRPYGLLMNFQGDAGLSGVNNTFSKNLSDTLSITGGAANTNNLTTGNIGVVNSGTSTNGALSIRLNKDVNLTPDGSLTIGNTAVNNTGLTVTTSTTDSTQNPSITSTGISAGSKQIKNVASGTTGNVWSSSNPPATGVTYDNNMNNAANIGDIYNLVSSQVDVQSGSNITVSPVSGGTKKFQVDLNDDITLGKNTANPVEINGSGTNASIRLGSTESANKVTFDGVAGTGSVAGVNLGQLTATPKNYTSTDYATVSENPLLQSAATALQNGADGTAQTGNYVTGLDNKDWNWRNLSVVSGRAATEDQVLKAGQHFFSINLRNEGTDLSTIPNYYNEGASGAASVAIGHGVSTASTATGSIAIGANGTATGTTTDSGVSGGEYALAVGNDAKAEGDQSMAIGYQTDAKGEYSLSIGNRNSANGIRSIAIGVDTQAGYESKAASTVSDDYEAGTMQGGADIALGNRSRVMGTGSTAIGFGAAVGETGANGQINFNSTKGADLAVAVGGRSLASQDGAVALGNLSYANRESGEVGYGYANKAADDTTELIDANGNKTTDAATKSGNMGTLRATYKADGTVDKAGNTSNLKAGTAWQANMGAVSIGSEARTGVIADATGKTTQTYDIPAITRQLTGLAAGTEDTDAVNVAQLKAVESKGMNFTGQNYQTGSSTALQTIHKNQGETLNVRGAEQNHENTNGTTDPNIFVTAGANNGSLEIALNDDVKVHTVTAGTTGISGKAGTVTIVGNNGTTDTPTWTAYDIQSGTGSTDLTGHMDRLTYSSGTDKHTLATLDDGLRFKGDDASTTDDTNHVVRKLMDQEMSITGGAATNNLSENNIGVVSNSDNTGLIVKLGRDLTGLNSIRVGTGSTTNGGINIGYQPDGNAPTTSNNYITGLENKTWNIGTTTAVSGRAATEDQLKSATDQLVSTLGNDSYASSGTVTYDTDTKPGTGTLTINRTKKAVDASGKTTETDDGSFTVDGLHDYYVTGASVGNNNHLTLNRNGLSDIDVDLSNLVTPDYQLIANPTEGSNGQYKPNSDGTMSLYVQNGDDTANRKTITLAGLSTNFDADTNTDHTNAANTVNLGGTQKIIGGDSDAKKANGSYTNGNIKTSVNSNGDIVINLNDDPTLKSVILQGSDNNITLKKGTGDRLTYTVGTGDTAKNYDIATTQDGYNLQGDNYSGSLTNGAYTALTKDINITGGAKTSGSTNATLSDANNIGTTVSQDENGNTTYTLKLNKNVSDLTSVTAGGTGEDSRAIRPSSTGAIVMGRQTGRTLTTVNGNETTTATNLTPGDYITGLDNTTWYIGSDEKSSGSVNVNGTYYYVSGQAATEDQLRVVSDQVGTNTTNITKNRTDIDAGWNAVVKNGTITTTGTGADAKETRSDATIKVNPTNNNLSFTEGTNIRLSANDRTITVATNPVVGFDTVKVAGTGSGGAMTGGIEIGSQTPSRTPRTYSETTADETGGGYTVKTYTPITTTASDGSTVYTTNYNWTAVHYNASGQDDTDRQTGFERTGTANNLIETLSDTNGKYVTGLDNKTWNNAYYVSGRAATEDQLSQVATQIRGEVAASDTFVLSGVINYSDGSGTTTDNGTGTLTLTKNAGQPIPSITGLHDYYVVSGEVLKPGEGGNNGTDSILRLTKNGAAGSQPSTIDIDLSDLATTDWQLVANPAEGSNGIYTPDANTGSMTLTVQDLDNPGSTKQITLSGLTGYFGADNTSSTTAEGGNTTWTNRITRNAGQQLNIKGSDTDAATGATYDYGNIKTTTSGDDTIKIALNDNPTLKSVVLKDSTTDDKPLTVAKSDDGTRLSYTATGGTKQDVANLNDGYTLAADNNATGVKTTLNKTVTIKGGAASNLTDDTYNGSAVNNIGTAVTQDANGNTTYTLKLNKDLTGLNTVTVGGDTGSTDTATPAVIGRQTVTKMTTNGTDSVDTKQTGDYVTGLDNKTWDGKNYVSGRGATEDQLKIVSDNIKNDVSTSDVYLQSAAATYGDDGTATVETTTHGTPTSPVTISGIHDYYVNSGTVSDDGKKITLNYNNSSLTPIELDLSKVLGNDMRLVGKAVTTGEGENQKTTYTGTYDVNDVDTNGDLALNVVSADGKTKEQVKIRGLAWKETVDKGVNYGSDFNHSVTDGKDVWTGEKATSNRQLGDTIGVFGGKTSTIGSGDNGTTYTHNNIITSLDGNGNIVVNLNDNPTLQSLQLTTTGEDTDKVTITKGTDNSSDRLTVTPAGSNTPQTVAYTSDALNFTGDTPNATVKRTLNTTLPVTGYKDSTDSDYQNITVDANDSTGLTMHLNKEVHVNTLRAGNKAATEVNDKAGKIQISGAKNNGQYEYTDITASDGTNAVTNTDPKNQAITRIKYKSETGVAHEVATLQDGYKLAGDTDATDTAGLNETLKISGGASNVNNLADANNIGVTVSDNTWNLKLNKDITGLTTVQAGNAVFGTQAPTRTTASGQASTDKDASGDYVTGLSNKTWYISSDGKTSGSYSSNGENTGTLSYVSGRAATEDQLKSAVAQLSDTIHEHESSTYGLTADDNNSVKRTLGNEITLQGAVSKDKNNQDATLKNGKGEAITDSSNSPEKVKNILTSADDTTGVVGLSLADRIALNTSLAQTGSSISLYGADQSYELSSGGTSQVHNAIQIDPDEGISLIHTDNSGNVKKDGVRITGPEDYYEKGTDGKYTADPKRDSNGSVGITNANGDFTARLADLGGTGYLGLGNTASTVDDSQKLTKDDKTTTVAAAFLSARYGTGSLKASANAPGKLGTNGISGGNMTRLQYLDENHYDSSLTFNTDAVHEVATLDDGLVIAADMDGNYGTAEEAEKAGEGYKQRNVLLDNKVTFSGYTGNRADKQEDLTYADWGNVRVRITTDKDESGNATGTQVSMRLAKNLKGFNTVQIGGTEENSTSATAESTIRIGNLANREADSGKVALTAANFGNLRNQVDSNGKMTSSGPQLYEATDADGKTYYTSDTSANLKKKYYTGSKWTTDASEVPDQYKTDGVVDAEHTRNITVGDALSTASTMKQDTSQMTVYHVTADGKDYYTTDANAGGTTSMTTLNPEYGRYMTGLSNTNWNGIAVDSDRAATEGQLQKMQQQVSNYNVYDEKNKIGGGFAVAAENGKPVERSLGQTVTILGDTDMTSGIAGNLYTTANPTAGTITIGMNDQITLGHGPTIDPVTGESNNDGTAGTIALYDKNRTNSSDPTVFLDGDDGTVKAGSILIGKQETTSTGVTNTTTTTGNYVTGLANKTWNPRADGYVSGRAATEDQLKAMMDAIIDPTSGGFALSADQPATAGGSKTVTQSLGQAIALHGKDNQVTTTVSSTGKGIDIGLANDIVLGTQDSTTGSTTTKGTKSSLTLNGPGGAQAKLETTEDGSAALTLTSKTTAGEGEAATTTTRTVNAKDGGLELTTTTVTGTGENQKTETKKITAKDGAITTGNTTMNESGLSVKNGDAEAVKVDNKGLTVKGSAADGSNDITINQGAVSMGGNQISKVASGRSGKLWDTDTLPGTVKATDEDFKNLNNAANIGDIYAIANSTATDIVNANKVKVEAGDNITVTPSDDNKTYTVALKNDVTLGKDGEKGSLNLTDDKGTATITADGAGKKVTVGNEDANKVTVDGSNATVTAGTGDKQVKLDGKAGLITVGEDKKDATTGEATSTAIKIGKQESAAEDKNGSVNAVTGLGNKSWDAEHITSGRAATEDQLKAVTDKFNAGMNFSGDNNGTDDKAVNVKNEGTLKLNGGETEVKNLTATTDKNIGVVKNDKGDGLDIRLAKNLNGLDSATFGGTNVVNGSGMIIGGVKTSGGENAVGPRTVAVTQNLISAGGNQIHQVASGVSGQLHGADTDGVVVRDQAGNQIQNNAVNVGDLVGVAGNVTNQINQIAGNVNRLSNRVNKVGAGAAALAALHPLDFDPDDKWDFAAGYGHYKDADAAAVGVYYRPNEDTMFSVGGSMGGGENMVNAGVSFKLGQGNHVSTSRVAMAKEIKSLRKEVEDLRSAMADMAAGQQLDPKKTKLFPDIPENHWAYEAISQLAGNGVVEGYPDGTFKGDRMMTRYEFAMLVYRAMQDGKNVSDRLFKEFEPELEYIRVDTVEKDKNGNPTIERVRVIQRDNRTNAG